MVEWVLGGLAGSLYMYNRENFMFDRTLSLKRDYQGQGMNIKQFALYREDIRDLMNLTISKMDIYLLVNTLQLGFCVIILTEGRPKTTTTPAWLLWLYAMTTMGACLYFLLSAWLALQASITAHSFGVRMLTQFVRLPVPSSAQVDAARAFASDFEGLSLRELLRIPVLRQQLRRLNAEADQAPQQEDVARTSSPDTLSRSLPQHIKLYRELQVNWLAFDAYARVSLALGTNQMMYALAYTVMHMLCLLEYAPETALACLLVCGATGFLLARLDLYLSARLFALAGVLLLVPPAIALLALTISRPPATPVMLGLTHWLVLLVFVLHIVWIVFIVYIAKADTFGPLQLPTRFRTVLYLDVFGQMEATPPAVTLNSTALADNQASTDEQPNDNNQDLPLPEVSAPQRQHSASASSLFRQRSTSGASSFSGLARRPELRIELADLCQRIRGNLDRDLRFWEQAPLAELVPGGYESPEVTRLRGELDGLSHRLETLTLTGAAARTTKPEDNTDDAAACGWLKLEWNPSGNPTDFFYCVKSHNVAWVRPREPERVLELESMQEELQTLSSKIEALNELILEENEGDCPQPLQQRMATITSEASESTAQSSSAWRGPAEGLSPALGSSPTPLTTTTPTVRESENDPSQEEMRFGGDEALHGEALQTAFGVNTDSVLQSFHPHRSFGPQETAAQPTGQITRSPPGQLPWRTFSRGSAVLVGVWLLGFLWLFSRFVLKVDIPVGPAPPLTPDLQAAAYAPHPLFQPTGMACLENAALVTERFAVHQLHLDNSTGRAPWWEPSLETCLAADPAFQSQGLRGVTLQCDGGVDSCSALLLGASGEEALRCPLGGQQLAGQRVQMFGGPWVSLVGSADRRAVWARREKDNSLVMLQHSFGRPNVLLPHYEVMRGPVGAGLHVLEQEGLLLSLHPHGRLDAQPLPSTAGASVPSSSPRHLGAGLQWLSVCAAGQNLLVLGTTRATDGDPWMEPAETMASQRAAVMWRLPLPTVAEKL